MMVNDEVEPMRCGVTVQYPFPVERSLHSKTGRTCDRHETTHCHSFKSDCWSFSVDLQTTDMSISVGIILSLFIRIEEDESLTLGCLDFGCVPRIRGICLLWIDKAKPNIKPIYECRCNGRLQTKRFTRLAHTGLVVELEALKIKSRLTNEKFASVKGECEI